MRDLSETNIVDAKSAIRTNDHGFTAAHLLAAGDLVFRARGTNNAAAFVEALSGPSALASPLIKIRVDASLVDPLYLRWFINLPLSQTYIGAGLQGSLVRMVSIEHLARMRVAVPPLEAQRTVVELAGLYAREAGLLRRIADLRESRGRALIMERFLGIDGRIHGD